MNGRLVLRVGLRDRRTVLLDCQGTYPLQVVRPQAIDSNGGLSLIVLLLSAGLLDGDHLSIEVRVEPGARLALRTQAATQVHAGCSSQTLNAHVGAGAWFSYVPHALVPHADADHHARTMVTMDADGRVLVADVLSPGRVAHGEAFAYRQVRLDLDVSSAGTLLARERAVVRPEPLLRTAQFGAFTHTAGVYVFGGSEPRCPESEDAERLGVSELAHGGWYVRALAHRGADLEQALGRLHDKWWCGEP